MKTLQQLSEIYNTDKGLVHSYIPFYETLFNNKVSDEINVLEIGILFGNSLMMWHEYFHLSTVYGVDDFSQSDGHAFYGFKAVNKNEVFERLSKFPRIKPFDFNSEDKTQADFHLKETKFDIVIDDACHSSENQLKNIKNYLHRLNSKGVYVCEDIQDIETATILKKYVETHFENTTSKIVEFNINKIKDDRILVIEQL